ncbi:MAG: hypothetical protein ACT4QC_02895 [Planctomycetaceae bacterium]
MRQRVELPPFFQKAYLARMIVSSVILTVVFVWIAVWPPTSFVVPMAIVVACVASNFVAIVIQRRKLRDQKPGR